MWSIVRRKFNDVRLKQYLLSTGEVLLIEWVKSWKGYWGLKKSGGIGQNTLGNYKLFETTDEIISYLRRQTKGNVA